ncbi:MAG TPA: hypothetical protein VMJ10_03265 [Kofleriaceae bacterium]|nr:hypothetical protein [Kofleriaceae bacterium]
MHKLIGLIAVVVVAACGNKSDKGGGAAETETVALADTGYVIDVPKGTTVEVPMKGFYSFKGARGMPQVLDSPGARSPDDIANAECEGRTDVKKEKLANGAAVTCKGPSKMLQGVTTTKILVDIAREPSGGFLCHLETDQDPSFALGICKSIRKK